MSIADFAEDHKLKPTTGVNEGLCIRYSIDCEREDPYFAIMVVPGIPGLRAVPNLVTIHPILPPTVH